MNELPWGDPGRLNTLTIPQLYCLSSDRPPTAGPKLKTMEEREAHMARRRKSEGEWDH